jgi:hypothetical protein
MCKPESLTHWPQLPDVTRRARGLANEARIRRKQTTADRPTKQSARPHAAGARVWSPTLRPGQPTAKVAAVSGGIPWVFTA